MPASLVAMAMRYSEGDANGLATDAYRCPKIRVLWW
jgi:hypothetical protein